MTSRWVVVVGCMLAAGCEAEKYDWAFYDTNGAPTTLQPNAMFVVGSAKKVGASMHRFDNYWFAPDDLKVVPDSPSAVQVRIGSSYECQCSNNGIAGEATEVEITALTVGTNRLIFTTSDTDVIQRWTIIGVSP